MAKKVTFAIVEANDKKEFETRVTKFRNEGWNYLGEFKKMPDNARPGTYIYSQAFEKEVEVEDK